MLRYNPQTQKTWKSSREKDYQHLSKTLLCMEKKEERICTLTVFSPTPRRDYNILSKVSLSFLFQKKKLTSTSRIFNLRWWINSLLGTPEMNDIIKTFRGIHAERGFTIEVLNNKHIIIQLENGTDYLKI